MTALHVDAAVDALYGCAQYLVSIYSGLLQTDSLEQSTFICKTTAE